MEGTADAWVAPGIAHGPTERESVPAFANEPWVCLST